MSLHTSAFTPQLHFCPDYLPHLSVIYFPWFQSHTLLSLTTTNQHPPHSLASSLIGRMEPTVWHQPGHWDSSKRLNATMHTSKQTFLLGICVNFCNVLDEKDRYILFFISCICTFFFMLSLTLSILSLPLSVAVSVTHAEGEKRQIFKRGQKHQLKKPSHSLWPAVPEAASH